MRAGGEFGKPGDNARRREKGGRGGATLVRSPGTNDANLPCKSRHISRHRAAEGRSCASRLCHPFSPSVFARPLPPSGSFLSGTAAHHSADPSEVDEKFSRVVIPGVIAPRADDESKIPRCKCDRSSSCGPPTGFRLFAQPGFLRIYRPPFRKLPRKSPNIEKIFMHVPSYMAHY